MPPRVNLNVSYFMLAIVLETSIDDKALTEFATSSTVRGG